MKGKIIYVRLSETNYNVRVVTFNCEVKGYQECRFDVKDGEFFKVLRKIGEKGRAFRIANERGELGHLLRELVASLWPVNDSITWNKKGKVTAITGYTRGNNDSFVLFCLSCYALLTAVAVIE